ncbi:hypothetical protein ABZY31_28415 [Streptomyces sp. NPDC006529]|uniref:hypothetical protein n=1 Tax=Streptomyces sp. NPDC006529 TaxID=3157177 RepID=UPI0033A42351
MSTHHDAHRSNHDGPDGAGGDTTRHAPAPDDPTAVAAAVGLGLLALGGWLLTTTRPWTRPDGPAVLALYWGSALVVLLCGLVLLRRGVHSVHGVGVHAPDAGPWGNVPAQNTHSPSFPLPTPPEPPA